MKKKLISVAIVVLLLTAALAGCGGGSRIGEVSKNLTRYEIEAQLDTGAKTVTATQKVIYRNRSRVPLTELVFNLYANGYREDAKYKPVNAEAEVRAFPHGKSYGDITVTDVTVNGYAAEGVVGGEDKNSLTVAIPELYPDETVTVTMRFVTKLANINHRLGYGDHTVNLGNWYPVVCVYENGAYQTYPYYANGDPFFSDVANYKVSLTVPNGYVTASTGTLAKTEAGEANVTNHYEAKAVRDFALVVSDQFKVIEGVSEGVKVQYYYFNDENAALSLETAQKSIATFNKLFGKYPYPTLSVVEADFVHGGMEYPGLIYIATDVKADQYGEVVVHETAHQWWYGVVGSDEVRYAWLDEGLTEFSTALFYEKNPEYKKTLAEFSATARQSYKGYLRLLLSMNLTPDTSMNRQLTEFKTEYEYVTMTYAKGQLLFTDLYTLLGEEKFLKGLQRYYADYQFANATPEALIGCFEKATARTLEGWFMSYIDGRAII